MMTRANAQQIAKNRLNLEKAARIKHNQQFDKVSTITGLLKAWRASK
jgi:hypothetical protein